MLPVLAEYLHEEVGGAIHHSGDLFEIRRAVHKSSHLHNDR